MADTIGGIILPDGEYLFGAGVPEAPIDDKKYCRRNGIWVVVGDDGTIPYIEGTYNVFLGPFCGINTKESREGETEAERDNGCYNVAMGVGAFRANVTGDHSTAIGFRCMAKNVSGDHNTCVGEDSLYENVTTSNNVAMGTHAAQNYKNGGYQVIIGAQGARYLQSGLSNTIIGALACTNQFNEGIRVTGLSQSVIIGSFAGTKTDNLQNVIVVGNGVYATKSNQITIGKASHEEVIIAGKKIIFNEDGSVSWESL